MNFKILKGSTSQFGSPKIFEQNKTTQHFIDGMSFTASDTCFIVAGHTFFYIFHKSLGGVQGSGMFHLRTKH